MFKVWKKNITKPLVDKNFKFEEDIDAKKKLIVSLVQYQGDTKTDFEQLQWIPWGGKIEAMPQLSNSLNEYFVPSLKSKKEDKSEIPTPKQEDTPIETKSELKEVKQVPPKPSIRELLKEQPPKDIVQQSNAPVIKKQKVDVRKYVVHCRKSAYDVYIGRPNPSVKNAPKDFKWGNPFKMQSEEDRDEVIRNYRDWIMKQPQLIEMVENEFAMN